MFSLLYENRQCLLSWARGFPRRRAVAAVLRSIVTGYRRWTAIAISARFMRDQSGSYAVMFGLLAPIFIGALALGSETGLWYSTQEKMQGAADSSAISAAVGLNAGNTNYGAPGRCDSGDLWLCCRLERHDH